MSSCAACTVDVEAVSDRRCVDAVWVLADCLEEGIVWYLEDGGLVWELSVGLTGDEVAYLLAGRVPGVCEGGLEGA